MAIRFTTAEKRDALAKRLAELSVYMRRSMDQGHDHKIMVTPEMAEDLATAAGVVALTGIIPPETVIEEQTNE